VVVRSGSCLRANVSVGPNVVVQRTVVDEDTRIDAGTVLYDSIVGSGVRLGPNTVSPGGPADVVVDGELYTDCDVGCVVGDRARTGANVTLAPGSRIGPEATIAHGATVVGDVSGGCEVIQ
jgi:glucose-1-phosphate thymidylyltransferase